MAISAQSKSGLLVQPIHLERSVVPRSRLLALLDAKEQERCEGYLLPHLRNRFLEAHAAVRLLLARVLNEPANALHYAYNPNGKPRLESHPECRFNLAHSGQMALLAISLHGEVGVDAEDPNRSIESDAIVQRYFSQQECAEYLATPLSDRASAFLRAWTRKEAYIKARGEGLAIDLKSFNVSFGPEASLTPFKPKEQWQITDLILPEGYVGALVYEGEPRTVHLGQAISVDQLLIDGHIGENLR